MGLIAIRVPIDWKEELSIYASEDFLKSVSDEYGWLGGVDEMGLLRCVLPFTILKKFGFRLVRFRVETIHLDEEISLSDEKRFLNSAMGYFKSIGVDLIVPASTNTIFRTYPDSADAAPYSSYIIDLRLSIDNLWANVSHKYRRDINNAKKKGVVIKNGLEYAQVAYSMIRSTYKKSGLHFMTYDNFSKILYGLNKHAILLIAEYNGTAQSCTAFHFSEHCAYAVHGGSTINPTSGAMKLIQWEGIKLFRELGIRYFDLLGARINPKKGSKQEGIALFKKYLGGNQKKGFIWKCPLNRPGYLAYCIGAKILWRGDIVDHERHKLSQD